MGRTNARKASGGPVLLDGKGLALTKQMTLPQRVLDSAANGLNGFWKVAEALRKDRPRILDASRQWSSWCYLPISVVTGIVAHLVQAHMTPQQVERHWTAKTRLLTAACAWRMTKGVYVFDPEGAKAIVESNVEEDLPDELFLRLPEWCPYISAPGLQLGEGLFIHGFFAFVDDRAYDSSQSCPPELNFEILLDPKLSTDEVLGPLAISDERIQLALLAAHEEGQLGPGGFVSKVGELARRQEFVHLHLSIPIGQGKFSEIFLEQTQRAALADPASRLARTVSDESNAETLVKVTQFFGTMQARLGALLLYLVSDKVDISPEGCVGEARDRIVANEGRGIRNYQAERVRPWQVGFRIGAEIRAFEAQNLEATEHPGSGTGTALRPHIRKAHWHSFWTGPRDEPQQRRRKVLWLPPTPVNVSQSDDLVPTMHKVVSPVRP